jgi:hypothetical protein
MQGSLLAAERGGTIEAGLVWMLQLQPAGVA